MGKLQNFYKARQTGDTEFLQEAYALKTEKETIFENHVQNTDNIREQYEKSKNKYEEINPILHPIKKIRAKRNMNLLNIKYKNAKREKRTAKQVLKLVIYRLKQLVKQIKEKYKEQKKDLSKNTDLKDTFKDVGYTIKDDVNSFRNSLKIQANVKCDKILTNSPDSIVKSIDDDWCK